MNALARPYDPDAFELGDPDGLAETYPEATADIARFTRSTP